MVKVDPIAPGCCRDFPFRALARELANISLLKKSRPKIGAIRLGAIDEVENKTKGSVSTIGMTPTLCKTPTLEHKTIERCGLYFALP